MSTYTGFRFGSKNGKDPYKNSIISLTEGTVADGKNTSKELEVGSIVVGYFTDLNTKTLYCMFGLALGLDAPKQPYDQEYEKVHLVKWIGTPIKMPSEYWKYANKGPAGEVSKKNLQKFFDYFINNR